MIPSANIVIIGGGGAGIAAASTALECAITGIIVLEKRVNTGGNSALAGGFLFGVESPPQERAKRYISRDAHFSEISSNPTVKPSMFRVEGG
jgi:urocanate reductase